MVKLKPCPICGCPARFRHNMETLEITGIVCTGCKKVVQWPSLAMKGYETFAENRRKWTERWNRRGKE